MSNPAADAAVRNEPRPDPAAELLGTPVPGEDPASVHLAHMFRRTVATYPYRPASRVREDQQWRIRTYAETGRRVQALARALVEHGIARGDRIALFANNCPEWIELDLAIMTVGAVPVPIYPTSTPDQLVHIVTDAGVRIICLAGASERDRVLSAADRMPSLDAIVTIDPEAADHTGLPAASLPVRSLADLVSAPCEAGETERLDALVDERMAQAAGDDVASLIYTSGTTGAPKGVMITHRAAMSQPAALDEFFTITASDHSLCFLPLSHALEWAWTMVIISHGCLNTYVTNPKTVASMLAEVRPTLFVTVPKLYEQVMTVAREKVSDSRLKIRIFDWSLDVGRRWWQTTEAGRRPDVGLRIRHAVADRLVLRAVRDAVGGPKTVLAAGGAPLRQEVEEFFASIGLLICQGYGLTESSPLVSFNSPGAHKFGTAGKPLVGSQIKSGAEGEILYRGPNIMKGYWNNPEATASTIQDGWLHTGDIGHVDDDGYLVITDRLKDIIVTLNGKNISPQPIEGLLLADPLFEQAVILGDNRPCLTLLVKPSMPHVEEIAERLHLNLALPESLRSPELAEEIRKHVAELTAKLPNQEQIRDLRLLWEDFTQDNGLLTPTLKVRRREVEKRFTEVIEEMYAKLAKLRKADHQKADHQKTDHGGGER
ncbi:MAG: long-chain fatty acid--CoA ligase [Acidipropionibacterium acidipropionici]|jgi:long-chain acyl-CoA synthetase|uniref:AMP-dependent synthetase/ligase n=1 Tax=Acidipropionibacterium acidipropionici TaxID=1748 RepID=UPI002F34EFCC